MSKLLSNVGGSTINYDNFKKFFKDNSELKNLVKKFDSTTVHLKTKKDSDSEPVDQKKSGNSVEKMAKRATAKRK